MTSDEADHAFVWVWLPGRDEPVVAGRVDDVGPYLTFTYGRSYLARHDGLPSARLAEGEGEIERIQGLPEGSERRAELAELATTLWADARAVDLGEVDGDAERIRRLAGALLEIAGEEPAGQN